MSETEPVAFGVILDSLNDLIERAEDAFERLDLNLPATVSVRCGEDGERPLGWRKLPNQNGWRIVWEAPNPEDHQPITNSSIRLRLHAAEAIPQLYTACVGAQTRGAVAALAAKEKLEQFVTELEILVRRRT